MFGESSKLCWCLPTPSDWRLPPAQSELRKDPAPQPDAARGVVAALAGQLPGLLVVVGQAVLAAPRLRDL